MSTRSRIGMLNGDGTITSIYVHFDGYPNYMGPKLTGNYNTEEKLKKLLALGDLSSLEPNLTPPEGVKHTFMDPHPETTVSYYRDRGEPWKETRPITYRNKAQYAREDSVSYKYLFNPKTNKWYYTHGQKFNELPKKYCAQAQSEGK